MKSKIAYVFLLSVCMLVLFANVSDISAINTGFATEELSDDDTETLLSNVNISLFTEEPQKQPIEHFDVNKNGLIAIGCSTSTDKTVCVYTSDGEFQYGYNFESDGTFGVEWNENILMIHFVRGDVTVAVNQNGKIEGIAKIQNTSENSSYWRNTVFPTTKNVNGNTYTIKNNKAILKFAPAYSLLTVTDENGQEEIIYSVGSMQLTTMITEIVIVLCFVVFVVIGLIRKFIKIKRDN